jgi:hypothetical protein
MNYPTHDTDWATSSKGNEWKRINGVVLAIGRKKDGRYWAMSDGKFSEDSFNSKADAMQGAEMLLRKQEKIWWY